MRYGFRVPSLAVTELSWLPPRVVWAHSPGARASLPIAGNGSFICKPGEVSFLDLTVIDANDQYYNRVVRGKQCQFAVSE
jgi:hypothetical protein